MMRQDDRRRQERSCRRHPNPRGVNLFPIPQRHPRRLPAQAQGQCASSGLRITPTIAAKTSRNDKPRLSRVRQEALEGPAGPNHRQLCALNCPIRPAASEQLDGELPQERALAPVHHRRTNSSRHNDASPLTRSLRRKWESLRRQLDSPPG